MSRKIFEAIEAAEVKPKNRTEIFALIDPPIYEDGRTKQSFADSTDINKMLKKAQTAGSLSHLLKYPEPVYGEFDGEFDLLSAQQRIEKANEIFADLPSEIRGEFGNNALSFVQFAGDPANAGKLGDLLPAIAEPGSYFPNPVARGGQGAAAATAPSEPVEPAPVEPVASPPATAPGTEA